MAQGNGSRPDPTPEPPPNLAWLGAVLLLIAMACGLLAGYIVCLTM